MYRNKFTFGCLKYYCESGLGLRSDVSQSTLVDCWLFTNADGSAESSSMSENETSLADLLFDVIEKHQIEVLQPGKHFILGGLYTSSVGASR